MTRPLTRLAALAPAALFATGLLGICLLAAPASAQGASPASDEPPPAMVDLYTAEDAQAALDARLIALKTVIRLTPEQEKLWTPLEAAIRQAAKNAEGRAAERVKAEPAQDFLDVLERLADAEAARAADLKTVIAAARPLVASLSLEQQRRIPAFLGMSDEAGRPQPTLELWIFEAEQE
ncbi:Spy/CpxP family protein refolding chaperone [Starkeya koreensis]|uniref:Spy/CpxP family protein refolding chaperone n=1 Tax=Ancylobacter koreensis TaxID=266121 RepID=A0ABT0DJ04_9HYPH|nr:Spy/CpxP family protein refolding chaperone [Ancylobacter koreensis]MCK0207269.1 Spy/CpxP family protein refolding chaperone [Ancylobacter koreensis]